MLVIKNNKTPWWIIECHGGVDVLYKRTWWHLRSHSVVTIKDLCSTYVMFDMENAKNSIFKYLTALYNAEIIGRKSNFHGGGKRIDIVEWYLVVDLGPKVPMWYPRNREIFDPNSGSKFYIEKPKTSFCNSIRELCGFISVALSCHKKVTNQSRDYWSSVRNIYRWLNGDAFLDYGGFVARPISVRIAGIEREVFSWLRMVDEEISPEQIRYFVGMGVLSILSKLMAEYRDESNLSMGVVAGVIALCGFELPKSFHGLLTNQSPCMWHWKANCYKKILGESNNRRAVLYFMDVSEIKLNNSINQTSGISHCKNEWNDKAKLDGVILCSVLSPVGGFKFMVFRETGSDGVILSFLKWLMSFENEGVTLVADSAQFGNSKSVNGFIKSCCGKLNINLIELEEAVG